MVSQGPYPKNTQPQSRDALQCVRPTSPGSTGLTLEERYKEKLEKSCTDIATGSTAGIPAVKRLRKHHIHTLHRQKKQLLIVYLT